jgi:lysozyme
VEPETEDWIIWQFSEEGSFPGIGEKIDLNVLVGGLDRLSELAMP